ncbi:MAG: Rieske 2Fe-2S domain-containing protein [Thermomicrobiales bacterium]
MGPRVSDLISESSPWLDGVAAALKQAYAPILGPDAPRGLKDALVGTWLGHPLHPAVVAMPIGLWAGTAALDLAGERRVADLMLGLGLATAVGAALTGAAQWQDATKNEKPRRLGALHASLNSVATGLYAVSLLARRRERRGLGIALSTLGYGLVATSSWIGGDLAYTLGLGVDHAAFEKPPAEWTDVAAEGDVPAEKALRVDAGGAAVMLVRQEGRISALGAVCPHLGGPLDEGRIEDGCVHCPWHDSVFRIDDGVLIHGPAATSVKAYDVRVEAGRVSVRAQG